MKLSGRLLFENTRKNFKLNLVVVVVLVIESKGLYFLSSLLLQWNSVNTDTKGHALVCVLSGCSVESGHSGKKKSRTLFQLS